jgi:nitrate reductase NapAB chaperone NapD
MDTALVQYDVTESAIAEMKEKYSGLTIKTPADYKAVMAAISTVSKIRVDVEKARKMFKADALEYGRKVDAEAKRITGLLLEVEEPLRAKRQAVDDAKARKEEEARLAEEKRVADIRAKIDAITAFVSRLNELTIPELSARIESIGKLSIIGSEYQEFTGDALAEIKTVADALNARMAEKIEREKEQEALRIANEQAAALRAEQERKDAEAQAKLDAERRLKEAAERKIAEQAAEAKRKEDEEILRKKIEAESKAKAERELAEKIAREERAKAEAEAKAKREAELRPDKEKLLVWIASAIGTAPKLDSAEMKVICDDAVKSLTSAQKRIL